MFKVIPAVDIKDGIVVHGKGGHRDQYQPLDSQLCSGARPADVISGLRGYFPFDVIYVADLDAIAGNGHHSDCVKSLLADWPDLEIWCDFGLRGPADIEHYQQHPRLRPVAGTETLANRESLAALCASDADPVLSLDFKAGQALGRKDIHEAPQTWPLDVIVLNLDHVGASSGPPVEQLESADRAARASGVNTNLYAGGGVRNGGDLELLKDRGTAGAVVATAIHSGAIEATTIANLCDSASN